MVLKKEKKSEEKEKVFAKKSVVKPTKKAFKREGKISPAAEEKETKETKTTKKTKVAKEPNVEKKTEGAKDAPELKVELKPERYWEGLGRRKTAVARVRLFTRGDKGMWVNGKPVGAYFPTNEMRQIAEDALKKMKAQERFRVTVKANGGGLHAQAEAVRHGTARALTKFNPDFRKRLKRAGFLTRDPRMVERKKFGLKKARRAPQWAKR